MILPSDLHSHLTGNLDFKRRSLDPLLIINNVSIFISNCHTDFTGAGYDLDL